MKKDPEGNIIEGATNQFYETETEGLYTVEITDEHGCGRMSDPYYFKPSGVEEFNNENSRLSVIPNPLTYETTIHFVLDNPGSVSIVITDIMGIEIAVPLNNEFRQAGNHSLKFLANDLAAGVYFCTLKAVIYIETIKIVVK